ncbi:HXXEE domain-containing protein [Micromonospora sp. DT81.3]|uniref:HXXEE domain-containing protein n=1 Tax=Micromonospora sp. DT81.3 TaxID=3416523 RepID=UPI003CF3CBC6
MLARYQDAQETQPAVLGSGIFLIPAGYYVLHILEELPTFTVWASRHFAERSELSFAVFEILTLAFVLLVSYRALRAGAHGTWVILAVAAQVQFGLNAVFHLLTAALFEEYSPGMVTAGALGLPITAFFLVRVVREERITGRELLIAIAIGIAIASAAIAALFI